MSTDPQEQPLPPPSASLIRFCNRCGAAWQPEWTDCVFCAAAAAPTTAPAASSATYEEFFSVQSSLRLYFLLLSVSAIGLLVALVRTVQLPPEADLVIEAIMTVITVCFAIAHRKAVLPSLKRAGPPRYFLIAPVIALFTFLFASAVVRGLTHFTGEENLSYSRDFLDAGYGWWIVVLSVSIQPAVIEEIAFRGVILPGLHRAMGAGEAIIVSSMMFGILHLSIPSLPHLVAIGLALGWLRHKSGSLYPCMLMHFTHNTLVLVAEAFGSSPWSLNTSL